MAKRGVWGAVVSLVLCASAWGLDLNELHQFDIPAQKLSTALVEFSRQAKAPVVSATPEVERFESPGVSGRMSLREALNTLLRGTGLDIRTTESGAIAVGNFGAKIQSTDSVAADATRMAQLSQEGQPPNSQGSGAAVPSSSRTRRPKNPRSARSLSQPRSARSACRMCRYR